MAFNNEIEEIKAQIKVLEKKLSFLEEIEKQPRMNLQQEGDYVIVSYNKKLYYRFLTDNGNFSWYRTQDVPKGYVTGVFEPVTDAETERLLEGLYYNHIEVKKEKEIIRQNLKTSLKELANGDVRPIDDVIEEAKEQQTKSPVEEAYKDWWGQYPETGTWDGFDEKRWQGFQAGYEFAYAISTAKEVMEKVQEEQKWDAVRESVKWCEEHPDGDPLDYVKPQTPEQVADGLKESFREAQKTEKWKELQRKIDDGDFDDFIERTNLLDFLKDKLGYSFDCCYEIVDAVSEWLPETQDASGSQNAYVESAVEGWNDAINAIRGKLQ
jgi:hypothetical protein